MCAAEMEKLNTQGTSVEEGDHACQVGDEVQDMWVMVRKKQVCEYAKEPN